MCFIYDKRGDKVLWPPVAPVEGQGKFATRVGSTGFSGVFSVPDLQAYFLPTGGSNCAISMLAAAVPAS